MGEKRKNNVLSVKGIVEIAIFTAIAFALDFLQGGLWRGVFLNGGSIGLAMLPILILCYRRGFVAGFISGFILSFLQMLGGVYAIADTWYKVMFQILLDYILAYPVVAAAGLFFKPFKNAKTDKEKIAWVSIGTVLGGLLKFVCHYLAGVIFWGSSCPEGFVGGKYLYSFVYNISYTGPSIVLCLIVMIPVVIKYPQFFIVEEDYEYREGEAVSEIK
jgi:thiamine transporter